MSSVATPENLDGLIDKIRREGVQQGQKEAEELIREAREQAQRLAAAAKEEAASLLTEAERRIERDERIAREALERAARDAVIALRVRVRQILERLVAEQCEAAFDADMLKAILLKVVESWVQDHGRLSADLYLGEEDGALLTDGFLDRLRGHLTEGVEFRVLPELSLGVAISRSGDSHRIEFSAQAATEMLLAFLNPRFAALFDAREPAVASGGQGQRESDSPPNEDATEA